jgi:hypothetical protein
MRVSQFNLSRVLSLMYMHEIGRYRQVGDEFS